jgi:hypothetical protein
MDSLLPVAAVALCLACPIAMFGIGFVGWAIARARGESRELSVGCMPGHGEQATTTGRTNS